MGGGSAPSIPQQNLGQEFAQIIKLMPKFGQAQFNLTDRFAPQFAQQDVNLTKQFAPQYAQQGLDLTKQFGGQYAQAGFDIAGNMAPQYLGLNLGQMQKAIAGSPLLSSLNQQAQSGLANQGADPLLGQLTTQAQEQLGQKGHLTDQEAYQQTQGTLGTFAGRNNVFNQASAQSFLDRDALVRKRLQEAQSFGMGVEGQRQSALGQAQNFAQATQGMNLSSLQGLGGAVQAPNYAGYAQAPNLAAYATPGAGTTSMASGIGATQGTTQPVIGFAQNLFDANQNAAATQNIAASNKSGATTGAGIGAIGTIAGGALAAY